MSQRSRRPTSSQSTPTTAGAPPTWGTGAGSGPPVTPATFAEAEKLMQVTMTPAERQQAADSWRQTAGAVPRASHRAAESSNRRHRRAGHALESDAPGADVVVVAGSFRAVESRRHAPAVIGRRHRVCTRLAAIEMDRVATAHFRATYEYLSQSHRAIGSKDPIDHHADQRSRARPREGGRCRDRRAASTAVRCTASLTA